MLTSLQIRDFAIIDAVEIEWRPGLTVLTGETGAGKSIVVDALQLFKIGYSWGGTTSLAVAYAIGKASGRPAYGHRLVRFSVGLESTSDLIGDLEKAFARLKV